MYCLKKNLQETLKDLSKHMTTILDGDACSFSGYELFTNGVHHFTAGKNIYLCTFVEPDERITHSVVASSRDSIQQWVEGLDELCKPPMRFGGFSGGDYDTINKRFVIEATLK